MWRKTSQVLFRLWVSGCCGNVQKERFVWGENKSLQERGWWSTQNNSRLAVECKVSLTYCVAFWTVYKGGPWLDHLRMFLHVLRLLVRCPKFPTSSPAAILFAKILPTLPWTGNLTEEILCANKYVGISHRRISEILWIQGSVNLW
jgi:hypothetical protein